MNIQRNNLSASRVELAVEIPAEAMAEYVRRAAEKLSAATSIEGFRPGKAPLEVVRARLGEGKIMEEAARLAVSKTLDEALKSVEEDWFGQPEITITKLAADNPFAYKAVVTLLPEVTLGEYKGLGLKPEEASVTDEEVETVIEQLRESRASDVGADRPVQAGDKVVADVKMFLDKVPLEGGQTSATALVIGKNYIVPGFDDHLIGQAAGETREFSVVYPADHHLKQIAGKAVEFSVTVTQVFERTLPAVDDALAVGFGLKHVAELKKAIRENLLNDKQRAAEARFEQTLISAAIEKSKIGEIYESLIEPETKAMLGELRHNVERSGGSFDDYLSSLQKTAASLADELRPQAIERIKASLVIRSIVQAEEIKADKQEIEAELKTLKARPGSAAGDLDSPAARRQVEAVLINRRVIALLKEWNKPAE